MSRLLHHRQEKNISRSGWISASATALLGLLVLASSLFAVVHSNKGTSAQAATSFSFTAAGDYAQTAHTTANLQYIGSSGANFALALGDLNYNPTNVTADQWSSYVKSNLPANFPFEVLAGNEDKVQLDQLIADLPDRIGNISGTYGKEYAFDYPPGAPLARFIFASPGGILAGYSYTKGSTHYNWVAQRIDEARKAGIRWIIVGIHEYCIVINSAHSDPCTALDLTNLLLSKKVDLILYGHKHNYQVTNQLALNNSTCPSLVAGSGNNNCIVDSDQSLTQGAGSVMVVTGTGGQMPLSAIDTTDKETAYFRTWDNTTWGVSFFTVSANQISMQFHGTSGGSFSDSFTISASGLPPTPSPSPSMTASPSPSPSPSPSVTASPSPAPGQTLAQDNFQRGNQTYWGTAADSQRWAANANSSKVFSISSNAGQIAGNSTNSYDAILGPQVSNAEAVFTGSMNNFSGANLGAVLRWTDTNNWYRAYIDGKNLIIQKKVGGTLTKLKSIAFAATNGTAYTLRFNGVGSTLSAKVWQAGTTEPTNWMLTVNDSSLTSGFCGLRVLLASGSTAQFTSFQATAQ